MNGKDILKSRCVACCVLEEIKRTQLIFKNILQFNEKQMLLCELLGLI